ALELPERSLGDTIRLALRNAAEEVEADAAATREDWEERVDALVERWTAEVTGAQVDALVEQIETVVDSGSPTGLADLAVPYEQGAALLAQAMREQATAAADRMAALAAEQGVAIAPAVPAEPEATNARPAFWVEPPALGRPMTNISPLLKKVALGLAEDLGAQASLTAKKLTNAFTDSASAEALRVWNPGATAKEVSGKVREHLEGLTTKTLGSDLSAAIWAAENEGRSATIAQAEEDGNGAHYLLADEVRDKNTCQPCKDIDNRKFDTLAEAEAEYPFGGYRKCDGRSRCRGTYVPYWS
ncbi:MAG TPA: hypothetical protein VJ140_18740, partial [Actinomycetota bacterium]|nr:hypothetical protein [Actinomycetota bacterium]